MRTFAFAALALVAAANFAADEWPQFRGPGGQGHATAKDLPVTWSETENVKWKTPIPGEAWSSPVVSGNQIWMTNATDGGKSLRAVCVSLDAGKIVFDVELFHVEKPEFKHKLNSYASPTPILDNGRLYCFFGTHGMACVATHDGTKVWENTDLKHDPQNGAGSTPIPYKDKILVCIDGMDVQYQLALNKSDGKVAWKTPRSMPFKPKTKEDAKKAYPTPLIYQVDGKDQMVATAAEGFYAYDPNNGKELWRLKHPGFSNVPIPVFDGTNLYMSTGFMTPQTWAVKPGNEKGNEKNLDDEKKTDLPAENIVWKIAGQGMLLADVNKPDARPVKVVSQTRPSPLLIGKRLYLIADNGALSCIDTPSGNVVWVQNMFGEWSTSPTFADGKIYLFNQTGKSYVLEPGDAYKKLAENTLEDGCMASPAVVGKALIVRTKSALYRIEK